jgi:hypothetical protein
MQKAAARTGLKLRGILRRASLRLTSARFRFDATLRRLRMTRRVAGSG